MLAELRRAVRGGAEIEGGAVELISYLGNWVDEVRWITVKGSLFYF